LDTNAVTFVTENNKEGRSGDAGWGYPYRHGSNSAGNQQLPQVERRDWALFS